MFLFLGRGMSMGTWWENLSVFSIVTFLVYAHTPTSKLLYVTSHGSLFYFHNFSFFIDGYIFTF